MSEPDCDDSRTLAETCQDEWLDEMEAYSVELAEKNGDLEQAS